MARGRKITKPPEEYATQLREQHGKYAEPQLQIRIGKVKSEERRIFLQKTMEYLEQLPVKDTTNINSMERKKKSSKKEQLVLEEMKRQGTFTIESILSVISDVSRGYIYATAKNHAMTDHKDGRTVVFRIGGGDGKKGYAVNHTFVARKINIKNYERRFHETKDIHRMVSVPRASRDLVFYYVEYPWFHKVESANPDEYVYWDDERNCLIKTGLQISYTKREDLNNWLEKYEKSLGN